MMLPFLLAVAAQFSGPATGAGALTEEAERLERREPSRARALYERAARKGYAPAQAALGIILFRKGDRAGAMPWLRSAAQAGEPRALLIYGTAMFNGDGVAPDRIAGYAMVRRAAAQGSPGARTTQSEMELVMAEAERGAATGARSAQPRKTARRSAAKHGSAGLPPSPSIGPWRIQLGAFRRAGAGQALFAQLSPRLPGKLPAFVPAGSLLRLQVGPYPSLAAATAACRSLGRQACVPVRVR